MGKFNNQLGKQEPGITTFGVRRAQLDERTRKNETSAFANPIPSSGLALPRALCDGNNLAVAVSSRPINISRDRSGQVFALCNRFL